jgi:hypothetical protein
MPGCPYCGEMHSQLYVCEAMRQARAKAAAVKVAVKTTAVKEQPAVKKRGAYPNTDARRAYMRAYMLRRYHSGKG